MIVRLWFLLVGHVRIRVTGAVPERLVNLAVHHGIFLWELQHVSPDVLLLNVSINGFKRLRPAVRKSRCRIHIVRREGLPFFWHSTRRRKPLLVGACFFFVVLYAMSSFVWFIEVKGLENLKEAEILAVVARYGLERGAWKGRINFERVARRLPVDLEAVAWAALTLRGTKVTIELIENELPPEGGPPGPADIVAGRDGMVSDLFVLRGQPLVAPGDTVVRGQTLIAGALGGPQPDKPLLVAARGRVKARVWYSSYIEVPLVREVAVRTGETYTRRLLGVGPKSVILAGTNAVPFATFEEEVNLQPLASWRNVSLPVELKTVTYHRTVLVEDVIPRAEAAGQATEEARQELLARIPVEARILRVEGRQVQAGPAFVGVKVLIETEEEIGISQPISRGVPGENRGEAQFESGRIAETQGIHTRQQRGLAGLRPAG